MTSALTHPLRVTDEVALGRTGNLSIVIWRMKPTRESALALDQHYRSMIERHASGFVSLIIIEDGTPSPDDTLRKEITSTMDAAGAHLRSVAVVLESKGFAAAALRAALTSMSMVTRSRFPRRFVASVAEALPTLGSGMREDTGQPISVGEASHRVAELRKAIARPSR